MSVQKRFSNKSLFGVWCGFQSLFAASSFPRSKTLPPLASRGFSSPSSRWVPLVRSSGHFSPFFRCQRIPLRIKAWLRFFSDSPPPFLLNVLDSSGSQGCGNNDFPSAWFALGCDFLPLDGRLLSFLSLDTPNRTTLLAECPLLSSKTVITLRPFAPEAFCMALPSYRPFPSR